MADLHDHSVIELLQLNAEVLDELRRRNILATSNAPLGDYAEWLFRRAFGWLPAGNSAKDIDAVGEDGTRYQVKARRPHAQNKSRQLGALRRLDAANFDVLAAVLFSQDFTVMRAALIPHKVVLERATYVPATNSWKLILADQMWNVPGVEDVTAALLRVQPSR